MSGKLKMLILLILLISVARLCCEYQYEPKHILVLHSYSPSMVWVDEINAGINSVINSEHDIEIQVTYEFLDAKRYNNELYFLHTAEALKFKYESTSFQAIISCDDHALDFLKKYRDSCFPDIPIFFCGVNNLSEKDLADYSDIKGVFEANPIEKNFFLIKKLLPDCEVILAVADSNTRTNQIYQQRIKQEIEGNVSGIILKISENKTYNELEEELASLPKNTAVLYFSYIVDSNGEYLSHIPAAKRILRRCNSPVFTINRIYLSLNVIGGYVTDPYAHGVSTAMMASDYLRGFSLNNIHSRDYLSDNLFPPVFNLKQLDLYSINKRNLPENAIIDDMEEFTRQQHNRQLMYLLTALLLICVVLVYMIYINIQNGKIKQDLLKKDILWTSLTENLPVIIFSMDQNGKFQQINSQVTRLFGIERDRIIGHTAREAGFSEAICLSNEQVISLGFPGQKNFHYEYKVDNPLSEDEFYCDIRYVREIKNGQILNIQGYIIDNTEKQKLFLDISESRENYQLLFDKIALGCAILEMNFYEADIAADFRFLLNNPSFAGILNIENDLVDKQTSNVLPDLEPHWIERFGNVAITGEPAKFIDYMPAIEKWIDVSVYQVSENQIAIMLLDITNDILEADELKLNNVQLINNNENLKFLLEEKTGQLQVKDDLLIVQSQLATLGNLFSTINSQWHYPLNYLDLYFQNLKNKEQFGDFKEEKLNLQKDQALKAIHLISASLEEFNFLFNHKEDKAEYDIGVIIRKLVNVMSEVFIKEAIEIELNLQEECCFLGFTHEYAHVILNLLNNSREAIKIGDIKAGKISIELFKDDNTSFLRILDNAGGIPSEYNEKIFTPFFTTKIHPSGAGLGLYISRKIIENKLHGKIYIRNVDDGAEFTIETPLCVM